MQWTLLGLSLANMARLVACALVFVVVSGFAEPVHKVLPQKQADTITLQRQLDVSNLFYHIHEPLYDLELTKIAQTWNVEKNIEHFTNITAVKIFGEIEQEGFLPRGYPYDVKENYHWFLTETLFNVLYSAKDYDTFYNTAIWLRVHVNEYLFVHVFSVALLHRHDTQGIVIPPIYEIFPTFFHNTEILTTAQRINNHGSHYVEQYPSTYTWENNVVIKQNMTVWPYYNSEEIKVQYFTHDYALNALYYNWNLAYPTWLRSSVVPIGKDRRGEWFWYFHRQLLNRYYMERLSNGLGEIPELGWDIPVEHGIFPGLGYQNGIPFPVRPDHFVLSSQPHFVEEITRLRDFERRVRDAIDVGYVINSDGQHIDIRTPEAIDILGNIVNANMDSPNLNFYGDFISIWKYLLGNSVAHKEFNNLQFSNSPLVLPSVLENYQTALRDPAFYMIVRRFLNIFQTWQQHLPIYKREELTLPSVTVKSVEVDKLVTYFENTYLNVTNHLPMNVHEVQLGVDEVSVVVERPRLNHKVFQVRVKVNSESAKTVIVRFFLAPKYDSQGNEIPIYENWNNFFQFDQFTYELNQGENIIKRDSTQNVYTIDDWMSGYVTYANAEQGLHGKTPVMLDQSHRLDGFPERLVLPKGSVGGMPFVFMVYISEYTAPKVPLGQGFDPSVSLGLGSGARYMSDEPFGFPTNRPVYDYIIRDLPNLWVQDVKIYHKHTPEIYVPHHE